MRKILFCILGCCILLSVSTIVYGASSYFHFYQTFPLGTFNRQKSSSVFSNESLILEMDNLFKEDSVEIIDIYDNGNKKLE